MMKERPKARPRRWLRRFVYSLLAAVGVVVLALAGLAVALGRPGVQQSVIEGISERTQTDFGFAVAAEGFDLGLLAGRLDVRRLELVAGAGEPFARVERVGIRFAPLSLLRGRLRLDLVELSRPVVDLDAQFPVAPDSATPQEPTDSLALTVETLRLTEGVVTGSAPAAVREILQAWRIEALEIDGSFDGRRLTVADLSSGARIERAAGAPIELRIAAAAGFELSGAVDVESLEIVGDELEVDAAFRKGSDWSRSEGTFRIATDVGYWLRGAPAGAVTLQGDLDLAQWSGSAHLASAEQPGSLWADLVLPDLAAQLELGATDLGLSLDLDLDRSADGARAVAGELNASASRAGIVLAELEARPRLSIGEPASEGGPALLSADLTANLRLLPKEVGVRIVTAQMSAQDVREVSSWRIDRGTLEIEQPRVARLLDVVTGLWPKLLGPSLAASLPDLGALTSGGTFAGPVLDPRIDARAQLLPPAGGRVDFRIAGRPTASDLVVDAAGVDLEIGDFTSAASGRVAFSAKIADPLGGASGSLDLTAQDVATASGDLLSSMELGLEGTLDGIAWRLDAGLAGGGDLAGSGSVRPETPLRTASGTVTWQTGGERVPRVDGTFGLAAGALSVAATAPLASGSAVQAQLELPLGALSALPELGDFSALPVAGRPGSIVAEWEIPQGEWQGFLPGGLGDFGSRLGLLAGASSGRIEFDAACASCSIGSATVRGLVIELDGKRAEATGDLLLELGAGKAAVEPWSLAGNGFDLEWSGEAALSSTWRPGAPIADLLESTRVELSADVDSSWLEFLPVEIVAPGTVTVRAEVSGPLEALVGSGRFEAPALRLTPDAAPSIVLAEAAADVSVREGRIEWTNARILVNDAEITSQGRARVRDPLADSAGVVRIASGLPVVTAAVLPFETADGWLAIEEGQVTTTGGDGTVRLDLPIGGAAGATASAGWDLPANDWAPLLARLGAGQEPELLEFASRGDLTLALDHPAAAEAEIELSQGRVVMRGRETVIDPMIELSARDGVLAVRPFTLRTGSESFLFEARADLDDRWVLSGPPAGSIRNFRILGKGDIDAGLLNPFLAGGRAEGSLSLDLDLGGTPAEYRGLVRVEGPAASILYRSPYLARFERPSLEISIVDGRTALERGDFLLNEGPFSVTGQVAGEGGTDLEIRLDSAAFRLDYGLLATLGADLRYQSADQGRATVSGSVDVKRGTLTRSVQLDLDLLSQLLAPIDLTTTEDDPLDLISLKLAVRTQEGVRIKNNLGDMLVRWEPLEVTGTLARPVVEGSLEVDPGGLLYAYGQTIRLDKAVIEYPGQEGVDPRLDFQATTSLEDPSIGQLAGQDPFRAASRKDAVAGPARQEITADLARFYGEQFAGKIGESVGVKVSLRPLLIFGETDPGARLTVSRDLSANVALAASVDLTSAEGRTYLLEAHELRAFPRLVAQAFTDDASAYGGALLQRAEFGGSKRTTDSVLARISKIAAEPLRGVSKRAIRRALALQKGDLFDPEHRFVAEVELVDYLMRKGYPDARVSVQAVPDARRERRVRLEVDIQPGPLVEYVFEGEKIAKPLRTLIRSLYRPDFFEPESIEEMRAETVRALRSRGFLEPVVEIRVEDLAEDASKADRRVVVRTTGGTKISPDPPVFVGLPVEDVEVLNVAFANAVQRVELAVGLPSADRRLLLALDGLGYPDARIASRFQTLGDRVLTVEIDPGQRVRIASVAVDGIDADSTPGVSDARVRERIEVAAGDPLRRNTLSRSAVAIERELGSLGYLDARVRTILEPVSTDDPYSKDVRFLVEPGAQTRVSEVEFKGLRSTRDRYARRVAGIKTGEVLARDDLSRARTALWRTGLFSAVGADTVSSGAGIDRVVFDLAESTRYSLTYGVRWASEDGMGAVMDATDDNFLGRGWTLGLRALTSNDEDSLRWLTRVPRAFGGPGSLELFLAARQLTEISTDIIFGSVDVPVDILEGTLQYSHPMTDRTTLRLYGRYTDSTRKLPFFTLRVKNPQLGVQYLYDSRSPEPVTERGVFASVDLSGSKEFLGGDLAYARLFSQLNLHVPAGKLFGSRLTWTQSYRLGLADAFSQDLIRDVRFFAGGEYSVRGYETESLGEIEQFGGVSQPFGGAALLIVNQEMRWRLFPDYTLVLFADAGNVWREIGDLGSDLFTSTGLGVRAVTPVGLLRLDIAHALDGRLGVDPKYRIYLGLGTTF